MRDPNIVSSLKLRAVMTLPDYHVEAGGESEEDKENAFIVRYILEHMEGSFLSWLQERLYHSLMLNGFVVSEIKQNVLEYSGLEDRTLVGIDNIKIKPVESFDGNIVLDDYGNIKEIKQWQSGELVSCPADRTLYLKIGGAPDNPYGTSVLDSIHDAWKSKQQVFRAWQLYLDAFAGGRTVAKLEDSRYRQGKAQAEKIVKAMSTGTYVVQPDWMSIERTEVSGTTANLYKEAITYLDKQIRLGILMSETVNAEGHYQGSYGSQKAQLSIIQTAFAGYGEALAEEINEKVVQRLMKWNELKGARPRFVSRRESITDIEDVLEGITQMLMQSNTLKLPESTEIALLNTLLSKIGVQEINETEIEEVEEESIIDIQPIDLNEPDLPESIAMAGTKEPAGYTDAELKAEKKQWIEIENKAIADYQRAWKKAIPSIFEALLDGLVTKSGGWKNISIASMRKVIEKAITKDGGNLRSVIEQLLYKRWTDGQLETALKIGTGVKAGMSITHEKIDPTRALEILSQDVYMLLKKRYATVAGKVYHLVRNALQANISTQDAFRQISALLSEVGKESEARTVLNTSLARAYNDGAMSSFAPLENADTIKREYRTGDVVGYGFKAVMDDVTTDLCKAWNGKFFKVDCKHRVSPPLHYNCRSILVPILYPETPYGGGEYMSDKEAGALPRPMEGFGEG